MFEFLKKKKPVTALDQFIFAVYGNPPPEKRANVARASSLACELLMGVVDERQVRGVAEELNASPIPYSTHDLALSAALNFFKRPEYMPQLSTAQMFARIKMLEWLEDKLVVPILVGSFEETLYKLYKPAPRARHTREQSAPKPIPAPDDERLDLVRRLIHYRISGEVIDDIPAAVTQQLERELPADVLTQTSEYTILLLAEQCFQLLRGGAEYSSAIRTLNETHSAALTAADIHLPIMDAPYTIERYVSHYLDSTYGGGERLSDEFIQGALFSIEHFYAG
jgi:hypothetical protein